MDRRRRALLTGDGITPIVYLLRDKFLTADDSPVTTPRTSEPGPGLLVFVQTDGTFAITPEALTFTAQTTPAFGDLGFYMSGGVARAQGRLLYGKVNLTTRSNAFMLGYNRTGKANTAFTDCADYMFLSGAASLACCNNAQASASPVFTNIFSLDGIYELGIMLRNDTGSTLGIAKGGALFFLKGGAFANWTLVHTSVSDKTATVYPAHSNYASVGSWSEIYIRDLSLSYYGGSRWLAYPADGQNMDAPSADGIYEVSWLPTANEVFDFSFRQTDADNRWIVRCDQAAGNVKLFERNAGTETQRGSTGTQTWTAGTGIYRLVVTASGQTIEVRVDDTVLGAIGTAPLKTSYTSASFNLTSTGVSVSGTSALRDLALWPRLIDPTNHTAYTDLAAVGNITLRIPKPNKVIQRSGASNSLLISGNHNMSGTRTIEASWNGGAYAIIATGVSAGAFSGSLTGLTAGIGTLIIRIADATGVTATALNVGIGDVFVVAGQSNAQGQGTNEQAYTGTAGLFSQLGIDYVYKAGIDPLGSTARAADGILDTSGGNSIWPLVATSFVTSQGVPVMMLPCAEGGSAILAWQPSADKTDRSTLYGQMHQRIADQSNGIKAVLWWQGEADASAGQTQAYYYGKLSVLASAINADFGVKIIPCKLQNCSGITDDKELKINDAIGQAWLDTSTVLAGPDLTGLASDDTFHLKTDVNLAAAANLWWAALQAAFGYA